MADEEITVTITGLVNDEQVTAFQDLIAEINNNSELNLDVKVDRNQIDDTKDEIKDVDGSEINVDVNADGSKAEEEVENVKQKAEEPIEMPIEGDTSAVEDAIDRVIEMVTTAIPELRFDADGMSADQKINALIEKIEGEERNIKIGADTSSIDNALTALAGSKLAEFGFDVLERAGKVQDSWNRLSLTFKNTGISVDSLKPKINELTQATGKSGSAVREWFNTMGVVGITNTELLSDTFKNMAGRAYQTGTTVENLEASIQRMALSGNAGARMLTRMGISSYQLANAMGCTNEEYVKMFKNMTVEERLQALNKAMGDGTEANEMYKHSWEGLQERASIAFGSLLVQIGKPVLESITPMVEKGVEILKQMSEAYKGLPQIIQQVIGGILAGSVVLATVASTLGVFSTITMTMGKSITGLVNAVSNLPKVGGMFTKFAGQLTKIFGTAEAVGTAGAEASAVGAGMESASLTLSGIASGASAMLAPLLELAVVIAVMIPVVTLLVAEALVCVKAIQMLISALDFGGIDLSSAVDGLKQLGEALLQLTLIMGEMTLLSSLTILYSSFYALAFLFSGLKDPVAKAVEEAKKAFKEINKLSGLKVDENIPDNLRKLQESLRAVEESLGSLASVFKTGLGLNILTLGGLLGDLNKSLDQAVSELKNAVKSINKLDFDDIDESKIEKIKNVAESLVKINEALGAMGDIQWTENVSQFWIPGDTIEALQSAKTDLIEASKVLSTFDGVANIPEGIGDKLKKTAESLNSVNEALKSMSSIDWEVNIKGFNPFKALVPALQIAKRDIEGASKELASFNSMVTIPEGTADKIKKVADVSKEVLNALKSMTQVDSEVAWKGGNIAKQIIPSFRSAKNDITEVNKALMQLGYIPDIPEGTADKIKRIADVSNKVNDALKSFQNVQKTNIDYNSILDVFRNAKEAIQKISTELQGLNYLSDIEQGTIDKINRLKESVNNVIDTIKKINEVNNVEIDFNNIVNIIDSSKTALNDISTKLKELNIQNVDDSVVESIKKLSETVKSVTDIINSLANMESKEIDFGKIGEIIENSLSTIKKLADEITNQLKNITIEEGLAENIKRVSDTLNSIVEIINSLNGIQGQEINFDNLGQTIENSISSIKNLADKIKGLQGIQIDESVPEKVNTLNTTAQNVVNAINTMNGLTAQEVDFTALNTTMTNANKSLKDIGTSLGKLGELEITEAPAEKIKLVGDASRTTIDAINVMNGLTGQDINFDSINTTFSSAKSSLESVSNQLKGFNELVVINDEGISKIQKVGEASRNAINAINTIAGIQGVEIDFTTLTETMTNGISSITTISGSLNTYGSGDYGMLESATNSLSTLSGTIQALSNVAMVLSTFPTDTIDTTIVSDAVTNIKTIATDLGGLSEISGGDYSAVLTALTTTLETMKTTLSSASGGFEAPAQGIGQAIVSGVKNGMSGLDGAIKSKVQQAGSSANSTATSVGKTLGTNVTNGFKGELKLADAMSSEMQRVVTAVQNGVNQAKAVAKAGAQAIVQAFKDGSGMNSPGHMYWAMHGEMEYINDLLPSYMPKFANLSEKLGKTLGDNFNPQANLPSNGQYTAYGEGMPPTVNIYVEGDINDERTMDKLVERLTRALTWSNATGNRSV